MKGRIKMDNLVSVITPAEKNERYINTVLESLRKQIFTNFEVLLLHSDISRIKKSVDEVYLNDDRFKFIETPPPADLNVGAARNIGLGASAGDYVYFLDSDD